MSISQIVKQIENSDGYSLSKYFKIEYLINEKETCESIAKNLNSLKNSPPWKEIFSPLLKICKTTSSQEQYSLFDQASMLFVKSMSKFENQLKVPIFKSIVLSYKYLSANELESSVQKLRYLLSEAAKIRNCNAVDGSPLLALVNCLLSIFISLNDYNQAYKVFETNVDNISLLEESNVFTVSERAQFDFNAGKINAVFGYTQTALKFLNEALRLTPLSCMSDRRLILTVLIPVQLSFGMIPSTDLLNKYELNDLFGPIVDSIINADVREFNQAFEQRTMIFIRLGIWDVISKAKLVVYRRILEAVCPPGTQIQTLEAFQKAICVFDNVSLDEAEYVLANLISNHYVYASISDIQKKFVLKKEGAFPPFPFE
ncbi:hypothetical protein TVAG_389640 [Trichomonas vaginalis G3]|uniref:Uncharacterized protein n=1 Tax=Trichomonas vaginalis (strain ATCC PRA-98 / G3) TaxID=412133 RepID=A2E166_TRIV3|nr:posttranscriptional tethering of RNA polymerase II gene DNA protein [Trichomonas vaginalis G3]EAY13567.1 hypothetical protein TVAG_389640 [Trichomonas vaginalis G3]KAI5486395.1 posttranscriptional tethering of RNA polymerase II gene DNA protein [Trichomonas vaginalis G3]|eukprot:XP_001325790.1 hypothetical protein [Trichomonas vaginalis G3]